MIEGVSVDHHDCFMAEARGGVAKYGQLILVMSLPSIGSD
jgi:hypothetical protein